MTKIKSSDTAVWVVLCQVKMVCSPNSLAARGSHRTQCWPMRQRSLRKFTLIIWTYHLPSLFPRNSCSEVQSLHITMRTKARKQRVKHGKHLVLWCHPWDVASTLKIPKFHFMLSVTNFFEFKLLFSIMHSQNILPNTRYNLSFPLYSQKLLLCPLTVTST